MKGTLLRFYVHENRRHRRILLYEWLLQQAKRLGIHGGSAFRAIAGFGRHGILQGDAILWPDGTRSSLTPHPSVIVGNKASVIVGKGVFVGQGKGMVPMDNPSSPYKLRCAVLDGVSYCN